VSGLRTLSEGEQAQTEMKATGWMAHMKKYEEGVWMSRSTEEVLRWRYGGVKMQFCAKWAAADGL